MSTESWLPPAYALQRAQVPHNAIRELSRIPGVGRAMAADLYLLGFHHVADLENADPEAMYQALSRLTGVPVDRCVLYVFRCCVYFATHPQPEPELLKWWNWKSSAPDPEPTQRSLIG